MTAKRKLWHGPELTVLVRSKPEEDVLAGCKIRTGSGPTMSVTRCRTLRNGRCRNPNCSAVTSS